MDIAVASLFVEVIELLRGVCGAIILAIKRRRVRHND
jgi:hypothetical protein